MDNLVTIVMTIFASSGFWLLIQRLLDRNSATKRMLLGLAHDRIVYLGIKYMDRGYILRDEYENLVDYLYKPYKDLGGNGFLRYDIAEGKCEFCGSEENLCIHHENGYSNDINDLVILCRKCHRNYELVQIPDEFK